MAGSEPNPPPRRSAFGPRPPADVRAPEAIVRVDGLAARDAEAVGRARAIEMLAIGPETWLAVGGCGPGEVISAIAAAAGEGAVCTDLTQARAVLRVGGPDARKRLARGCPMDLGTVPPGGAAATMLGPFEVVIRRGRRPDEDAFDVFVSRSAARSAHRWLHALDPSV